MSEYSFAPLVPVLLPDNLNYPEEVISAIETYEKAWENWAEREGEFLEAKENLQIAETLDNKALEAAVEKGSGKHPGHKHRDEAKDALDYAYLVARKAHKAVREEISHLQEVMKTHSHELILDAIRVAREGSEEFEAELIKIQQRTQEVLDARNNSLTGMKMAAGLLQGSGLFIKSFSPQFPLEGDFRFPYYGQSKIRLFDICDQLEADITPKTSSDPQEENAA